METPKKGDEAETTLPVLTPKIAGGSQRVIKQIMVIDPNKLRLAGLDVKMAEALKKAKKKNQSKSKESKLAAAKSVLNKKLKEALSKKDVVTATSLPQTTVKSADDVAKSILNKKLKDALSRKDISTAPSSPQTPVKSVDDATKGALDTKLKETLSTKDSANATSLPQTPVKILKAVEEAAKSVINKKLKEALSNKDTANAPSSPQTPVKTVKSVEEAAKSVLNKKLKEALSKKDTANTPSTPQAPAKPDEAAKIALNKNLIEALKKKDTANAPASPQTPLKTMKAVEEVAVKVPPSDKKQGGKAKPKISVATLKSLMPPPSFPTSSLISPCQTVEIKVLKSEKTKQSIEVKIVDASADKPQKIDVFPKASLKPQVIPKIEKATPEVKCYGRKKSHLPGAPDQSKDILAPVSAEPSQTIIVHLETNKKKEKPKKESSKEKDASESDHCKTVTNAVEPLKNKPAQIVHTEPAPVEDKALNESITQIPLSIEESLIPEVETSTNTISLSPIPAKSLPTTPDPCLKIVSSTPIRRESLPKVIESKVLAPGEKIDLSILTQKTPTTLTVPKKRYKLDQNWISSESNRAESVYINLSPVAKPSPPKDAVQESAVDFINNLSLFFAESPKNKSINKSVPDILTQECSEDATSFLVSLFQQKQEASPNAQKTAPGAQESEGSKKVAVKSPCEDKKKISDKESSSKSFPHASNHQVLDLDKSNSESKKNIANRDEQLVLKTLHETTLDASKKPSQFKSEKKTFQDSESMISILETKAETDKSSKDLNEPYSCTAETSLISPEESGGLPNVPTSSNLQISSTDESLQKPVLKSLAQPVSTRRKGSKPIPVLIPKLKKSRKPPTPAEKPPEKKIIEKPTEKPQEESPTQPVRNKEASGDSVPSESNLEAENDKKELPEKSPQITIHKINQASTPTVSKDSSEILDELPTTSKSERPQRQRKMSLKFIESSESRSAVKSPLQGSLDKTVEQGTKKNKELPTLIEKPQRQRKVSFKLLDPSDPTVKSPLVQETPQADIELATKTERPQRQRRMTLKLLESSESLPSMKSLSQVNSRSVEQEMKDTATEKETPKSPKPSKVTTNSNDLISVGVMNDTSEDPIAQLDGFHETVEKFELARETVKSNSLQIPSLEEESGALPEYPFFDAISSEISNSSENQPTVGKENVSGEQTSTKILRRRKDSLKSRKFGGDQISIVSNDSLDLTECTTKDVQNMSSIKPNRKRKGTPTICNSEKEEEFTPKLSETKCHARNLISEIVQNEETFSAESREVLNNSEVLENLNVTAFSPIPSQTTHIDTPSNKSGKKRRGRPPKLKKTFPKPKGIESVVNVSQTTKEDTSDKTVTTEQTEMLPFSSDVSHTEGVAEVKLLEQAGELEDDTIQPTATVIRKNSSLGGSWETLSSADENIGRDVSKSAKKRTRNSRLNSNSSKNKGQQRIPESKDKVNTPEEVPPAIIHTLTEGIGQTLKSKTQEETPDSKDEVHDPETVPLNVEDRPTIIHTLTEEVEVGQASECIKGVDMVVVDLITNLDTHETLKGTKSFSETPQKDPNEGKKKSPMKENESELDKDLQVNTQEIMSKTSEPPKSAEISSTDSLKPAQVETEVSETTSKDDYRGHSEELTETLKITEINEQSTIKQTTTQSNLPEVKKLHEKSMASEVLKSSTEVYTDASHINEKQSVPNDEMFDELKPPTTGSQETESSKQNKELLKTKEPTKIRPPFDEFLFDLDHIESPSFSPICESSRTSNDLDGFEAFDDDLTSAIINTVTEAESAEEKSKELEKSLNSPDDNLKTKKESISSTLVDPQTENIKQCLLKSPEKQGSKPISIKESLPEPSAVPSLEFFSKNSKLIDELNEASPSVLAEECTEENKESEQPAPEEVEQSSVDNCPISQERADKEKQIPENFEPSDEGAPHSALNSTNLSNISPNHPESIEELTYDKVKQSSALYTAVLNKSAENEKEPRKNKAKNPFKKQILKDNENESKPRSEFLGFNEEEIEEGQQLTSLRLSQSEDMETLSIIESPSVSKIKPKNNIKESLIGSGKKQKQEKQKWEKNSAKSLKNWLSKPAKSGSKDDVYDKEEDVKEQSSSVPPKKRRGKVQDSSESISLEKDAKHLGEKITDADTTINSEADVSMIDNSVNSSGKKEKPKRGRKPKLKNPSILEKNLNEEKTSFTENISPGSHKSIIIAKTSLEDTPKRLDETNDHDFKTPKGSRKSKAANQSADFSKEPVAKERANKRKRSVSQENTPSTSATPEPPAKIAHLDGDIIPVKRKPGRPRKFAIDEVSPVPIAKKSPKEKKYKDDYEFNPRLLLIRKKEELKSNEPLVDPSLQTEPIGPDDVQCALCMGYTSKKKWIQHVSTHYGIGWIVGRPPPLNINSRGSILSFLLEFYKVSKVKGLNCRLCNSLRRSALGLLMHIEQCCLTEAEIHESRVVCEYCKRNYTKSSYQSHKRTCSDYLKQVLEEAKVETVEVEEGTTPDDVLSNTGRLKRKAVILAETKLKKLDEATEFVPDDLIKYIPSKNIRSIESIMETWVVEINSFGKGFCASKTCPFTATAIDDLIDHYQDKVCQYYEKAGYFCAKCKFHSENIEAVRSHVIDKHSPKIAKDKGDSDAEFDSSESSESIGTEDDEAESEREGEGGSVEEDADGERKRKRSKKKKSKAKRRAFQSKHPPTKEYKKLVPDRCSMSNIQDIVSRFYDNFIEANYSLDPLFTFATAKYVHMEASESYFPKSADSIKFKFKGFNGFVNTLGKSKVEADQWKQLERLHGLTENGEYIIYMGGPVKNIAWVPLDPHPPSNTQYLAVTVRKGLDKFTRFSNQKRSRSLIFILKFDITLPLEIKSEIIYAIAIDEGPIHALEFLPSGGYSAEMNRLGMLAVGTIETEIKIYSLPLKVDKNDCDLFPIIKLEASIELHLEVLDNPMDSTDMYNSQCTCIVWSQTAGHNIIVASFLNGFVGIWDISDDPGNLNRFDLNKRKLFTPVSFFWTLEDRLMHLALHYDMNGPRWLAASNSTRKLMIYDLRDITQPMLLRVEVTINIINCVQWPVVWENVMFGLGDAMPSNGCVISVLSPMYIMFASRRFEKFCTGVSDINFNIWRNCFAAGADNGDVQVTPLREAVLDVSQRLKIDEKIISTLDIVPLNGESISQNGIQIPSEGMRVFDKDFKDQYGIVFGTMRTIKGCNKPDYYNTRRVPPLNLHRLMRISKIRFNQNKNACDVLAIGYENGLIRVSLHESKKRSWH